jgi:hypothetical protein
VLPGSFKSYEIKTYVKAHETQIYNKVIKPAVLYGCETWAVAEQVKSALKTWERQILRNICDPTNNKNGCRIRISDELQAMYRKPNTVKTIN